MSVFLLALLYNFRSPEIVDRDIKLYTSHISDYYIFCDINFTISSNFQSLEVVDRVSETQFQGNENLN